MKWGQLSNQQVEDTAQRIRCAGPHMCCVTWLLLVNQIVCKHINEKEEKGALKGWCGEWKYPLDNPRVVLCLCVKCGCRSSGLCKKQTDRQTDVFYLLDERVQLIIPSRCLFSSSTSTSSLRFTPSISTWGLPPTMALKAKSPRKYEILNERVTL